MNNQKFNIKEYLSLGNDEAKAYIANFEVETHTTLRSVKVTRVASTGTVASKAVAEANALGKAEVAAKAKTSKKEEALLVRQANAILEEAGVDFNIYFKDDEVTFHTPATAGAKKVDIYQGKNIALTDGFERKLVNALGAETRTSSSELDFDELELKLLHAELGTDFAPEKDNDLNESPYLTAVTLASFYASADGVEHLANVTAQRKAKVRKYINDFHNAERSALRAAAPTAINARRAAKRAELEAKRAAYQTA